jgi:hypothetical protein
VIPHRGSKLSCTAEELVLRKIRPLVSAVAADSMTPQTSFGFENQPTGKWIGRKQVTLRRRDRRRDGKHEKGFA